MKSSFLIHLLIRWGSFNVSYPDITVIHSQLLGFIVFSSVSHSFQGLQLSGQRQWVPSFELLFHLVSTVSEQAEMLSKDLEVLQKSIDSSEGGEMVPSSL